MKAKDKKVRSWDELEAAAQAHANRIGLFITFQGRGNMGRYWQVYDADSGDMLLLYTPGSLTWSLCRGGQHSGKSQTCHHMLEFAQKMKRAITNSTSG